MKKVAAKKGTLIFPKLKCQTNKDQIKEGIDLVLQGLERLLEATAPYSSTGHLVGVLHRLGMELKSSYKMEYDKTAYPFEANIGGNK